MYDTAHDRSFSHTATRTHIRNLTADEAVMLGRLDRNVDIADLSALHDDAWVVFAHLLIERPELIPRASELFCMADDMNLAYLRLDDRSLNAHLEQRYGPHLRPLILALGRGDDISYDTDVADVRRMVHTDERILDPLSDAQIVRLHTMSPSTVNILRDDVQRLSVASQVRILRALLASDNEYRDFAVFALAGNLNGLSKVDAHQDPNYGEGGLTALADSAGVQATSTRWLFATEDDSVADRAHRAGRYLAGGPRVMAGLPSAGPIRLGTALSVLHTLGLSGDDPYRFTLSDEALSVIADHVDLGEIHGWNLLCDPAYADTFDPAMLGPASELRHDFVALWASMLNNVTAFGGVVPNVDNLLDAAAYAQTLSYRGSMWIAGDLRGTINDPNVAAVLAEGLIRHTPEDFYAYCGLGVAKADPDMCWWLVTNDAAKRGSRFGLADTIMTNAETVWDREELTEQMQAAVIDDMIAEGAFYAAERLSRLWLETMTEPERVEFMALVRTWPGRASDLATVVTR